MTLFLNLRIPCEQFQRVPIDNVDLQLDLVESGLRQRTEQQFNLEADKIVFVYHGRPLKLKHSLAEQGVRSGATINVMTQRAKIPVDRSPVPNVEQLIMSDQMRSIFSALKRYTASRLWEHSHPRVISRVIKQFPEIRDDLGALAILRDPILLSSMKTAENFQEIARQYPIFVQAAPVIAEALNKLDTTKETTRLRPAFDDSETTSSSSSSEDLSSNNPNNNNNNNNNAIGGNSGDPSSSSSASAGPRPITQRQLADALAFVGAAFRSAQSNRGSSNDDADQDQQMEESAVSPSHPEVSAPSANAGQQPTIDELRTRFAAELQQMQEMGLLDETVNLQALQVCNGNLEAALNLVFSSRM